MNANPMEAKATKQHNAFLQQFINDATTIKTKPKSDRVVSIVQIDEKDRAGTDAAIALFRTRTALTPARHVRQALEALANPLGGENPKVFAYGRTSHSLDGGSKERQTNSHEKTASDFNLGPIAMHFHDDDVSGADIYRPDWDALEKELRAHPGAILIIEEVDRLFRTPKAASYIMQVLLDLGIRLYDRKGHVSDQRLIDEAGKATNAYVLLRQRSADARVRAMASGKYMPTAPWGYYKVARGRIVPNRDLVSTVRKIFEMRARNVEINTIGRWLTEQGLLSPTGLNRWDHSTLSGILRNFIYVGLTCYECAPPEGEQEALLICEPTPHTKIVDFDLFYAVQQVKPKHSRARPHNGGGNHRSVLTGKVRCAACGAVVRHYSKGALGTMLRCTTKRGGCGTGPVISKNMVETMLYKAVASKITTVGAQDIYSERLESARARQEEESNAARDRLDSLIAEKQALYDRQVQRAWREEMMDDFAGEIKRAKTELLELRSQRSSMMPTKFVPHVVQGLQAVGAALQVVAENVPFRITSTKSEELIRTIRAVVSAVLCETTEEGRIRQTTVLDFNGLLRAGHEPDLSLRSVVVSEYDAPIRDEGARERYALAQMMKAGPALSDEEYVVIRNLEGIRSAFKRFPEEEVRRGLEAVAFHVFGGCNLKDCLKAMGLKYTSGFGSCYHEYRQNTGLDELRQCFERLRPGAALDGLMVKAIAANSTRAKFEESKHALLSHPLCTPGSDRTALTDSEWQVALSALRGNIEARPDLHQKARHTLDAYFAVIREGHPLRLGEGLGNVRSAYKRIENWQRSGAFNRMCVALLVHEGLRNPESRSPLPSIGPRKAKAA